jgi:hypothetical protein
MRALQSLLDKGNYKIQLINCSMSYCYSNGKVSGTKHSIHYCCTLHTVSYIRLEIQFYNVFHA